MKHITLILSLISSILSAQPVAKKVILFTIDGLHWEAPAKLEMPVFNSLIRKGTYIEQSYMIIPHHPTIGDYSKYNSCSFPNPVLHEGTVFLSQDNKMIQEVLSPPQQTAFVVNTVAYRSVGRGFSTQIMDDQLTDREVVECAMNVLKTQNPVFMRVHLQRLGQRGYDISQSTSDKSYYRNIFGNGSPYIQALEESDKLLGQFIDFLKSSGIWNETVLIVTSDHGQSKIGWHPLFDKDSWRTPLLFVGQGIAQGRQLTYFEHTDLASTIAGLLGEKPPSENGGAGNFIKEVLDGVDTTGYRPETTLKTINEQIKEYNFLRAQMILKSKDDGYFAIVVALLENETFAEPFYHQDRILDWHKAGTVKHLIETNEKTLAQMRKILEFCK